MRELTKALQVISHKTRMRILALLLERECCVCEVGRALEISRTRASRNLNILQDAGLLKLRKRGARSLYSIDRGGMGKRFAGLVQAVEQALEGNPAITLDRDKLKDARQSRPGMRLASQARHRVVPWRRKR